MGRAARIAQFDAILRAAISWLLSLAGVVRAGRPSTIAHWAGVGSHKLKASVRATIFSVSALMMAARAALCLSAEGKPVRSTRSLERRGSIANNVAPSVACPEA